MIKRVSAYILGVLILATLFGCTPKTQTKTEIYFDTVVTLTAEGEIPSSAFELCQKYEKMLSATDPESDISKLNKKGKITSSEIAEILKTAKNYGKISNGRFDVTIYPLKKLWGFGQNENVPSKNQIDDAILKVDYRKIEIEKDKISLPKGFEVDLGGIAKGYIADKIAEVFKADNLNGIINLGGNITIPIERAKPYKIGIVNPKDTKTALCYLEVTKGAISTSGTYQRNFTKDGITYHHILDTSTGYPVESEIESVTIIAPSSISADALSTSVFCLGIDEGMKLVNSLQDTEAVIITEKGKILLSDSLKMSDNIIKFK